MRFRMLSVIGLLLFAAAWGSGFEQRHRSDLQGPERSEEFLRTTISDCTFEKDPDRFLQGLRRHMEELSVRTDRTVRGRQYLAVEEESPKSSIAAVPLRNFVDDHIFGKMRDDDVPHAALSSDAEFLRRVSLDLTGRIPPADLVRLFLASDSPNKREELVRALVGSSAFVDKWTMFFGDLLQNTQQDSFVTRYPEGRNAFHSFIRNAVESAMPYNVFVERLLTAAGNDSFSQGELNWLIGGRTPMGPIQDTYDTLAVRTSTQFLGISSVDCLLCHDGAGHLDKLNVWATATKRQEVWGLAAFFSRTQIAQPGRRLDPPQNYYSVAEGNNGDYRLNTDAGNRTPRQAFDGSTLVKPKYFFTSTQPIAASYRQTLAKDLVADRQFARAAVNYLWREMMGMGIVEPADQFDLSRLDPGKVPAGWTVQPSHPQLLEALTDNFIASGFNVRALLSTIANSSAYQLSSRFTGEWKVEYTAYYARKFVRRMSAEEVHDAIAMATGIRGSYRITGIDAPIEWAMQLPDTEEPRRVGAVRAFLDIFLRGNRDSQMRSGDATILQALNMMNNTIVTTRIRSNTPGSTVGRLLANASLSDDQLVEELYLGTLGRFPTTQEKVTARDSFKLNRVAAAENLHWALMNKIDFLYNY